jgi:hypothetical protein
MEVCVPLALMSVVVARWSKNLFIFFIIFWAVCIVVDDCYRLAEFSQFFFAKVVNCSKI